MRVKLTRFMRKAGTEKARARHVTLLISNPRLLSWGRVKHTRHVTLLISYRHRLLTSCEVASFINLALAEAVERGHGRRVRAVD